jgi:hypothetical protein
MEYSQVVKMGYVIQDFLEKSSKFDAKPPELMGLLIEKGFFKYDIREGKPLRDVLRKLDDNDLLYLLPQVRVDRMGVNRQWFFNICRY